MDTLIFDFDLPFEEAIAWSENRVSVLPADYYGVFQAAARARAFTVSGLTAINQIQDALDGLTKVLKDGVTFDEWRKTIVQDPQMLALGKARLETIFRTNIQTNYSIGRTQQQRENVANRPFLMYDAINDARTRPNHMALDNFIAPAGDPIWRKITPPNGFNCRCAIISLTEAQARKRGWKGFAEYRADSEPDKGWDYNPADSQDDRLDKIMADRLAKANPTVAQAAQNSSVDQTKTDESRAKKVTLLGVVRSTLPIEQYEEPLSKLHPRLVQLVNKTPAPKIITTNNNQGAYKPLTVELVANPLDRNGNTMRHEYGHYIDAVITKYEYLSASETDVAFKAAFEADRKNLGLHKSSNVVSAVNEFLQKHFTESIGKYGIKKYTALENGFDEISDIYDAMMKGAIFNNDGPGHGPVYYKNWDAKASETFANLFALRGEKAWSYVEEKFPNLAKRFDELIYEALNG